MHDVGEVAGEGLHVLTRLALKRWRHPTFIRQSNLMSISPVVLPIIFSCFDEIVDLRVYKLEYPLLGRLSAVAEFLGSVELDLTSCGYGLTILD